MADTEKKFPIEIEKFYDNLNFIKSYSTPQERVALIRISDLPPNFRPDYRDLYQLIDRKNRLQKPFYERLRKINLITKQILDKIWRVDPHIYAWGDYLPEEVLKSELIEI